MRFDAFAYPSPCAFSFVWPVGASRLQAGWSRVSARPNMIRQYKKVWPTSSFCDSSMMTGSPARLAQHGTFHLQRAKELRLSLHLSLLAREEIWGMGCCKGPWRASPSLPSLGGPSSLLLALRANDDAAGAGSRVGGRLPALCVPPSNREPSPPAQFNNFGRVRDPAWKRLARVCCVETFDVGCYFLTAIPRLPKARCANQAKMVSTLHDARFDDRLYGGSKGVKPPEPGRLRTSAHR